MTSSLPLDQIICGDNLETMRTWPDACIDAIVTDPPYGLSFMGKKWDYDVPSVEVWAECLRVLKPGGHLLAFAGTRTQHRMCSNIEDAGFEIRDMIAWVYGSGFPKSLDVGKAIDKAAGAEREVVGQKIRGDVEKAKTSGSTYASADANKNNKAIFGYGVENITAPATDAARQWSGWGTALKPAMEPITVARKPLIGTVAENVLTHGTGAINVDGCRVGTEGGTTRSEQAPYSESGWRTGHEVLPLNAGRWPANLIHDGSDEVVGLFPQTGNSCGRDSRGRVHQAFTDDARKSTRDDVHPEFGDSGSAARFFYTAKADRAERGRNNNHPTVKPVDLMRYLVRLVTPIGAIVFDPFSGSGTTCVAAKLEFVKFIGIEREAEYVAISQKRLQQNLLF